MAEENTKSQEQQGEQGENNPAEQKMQSENSDKKYSDADVDALINKKFAEWSKKRDAEVDEAKKLAEMNETEKSKYERDKLQKQLDELMAEKELNAMTKTARSMLSEAGIAVSDELLSVMVTTDAEKTKSAIDSFTKLFTEAVENTVKERLKGKPPKASKSSDNGGKPLTAEKIAAIKDPVERQQAILDNKELFNL